MHCTQCGIGLRASDRFCPQCGSGTLPSVAAPRTLLRLNKRNKKIAGVCAGFAKYLGADVTLVRVLWLGIALATGVGFLV